MDKIKNIRSKVELLQRDLAPEKKGSIKLEILSLLNTLSTKRKSEVIEELYSIVREDISLAFSSNNYQGIIDSYNLIKNTRAWNVESDENKIIMHNMLVLGYLIMYLEKDRKKEEYYFEAKNVFKDIEKYDFNQMGFTPEQYIDENKNFKKNKVILDAITNNDIWTKIDYEIPFPIYISPKNTFFMYNDVKVKFKTEIIPNENSKFSSNQDFIGLEKDNYGLLNKTIVTLNINKYLSSDEKLKVYMSDAEDEKTVSLLESLEIINYIIQHYKIITNNYWIENVSYKMIETKAPKIYAGDIEIRNILIHDENTYNLTSEIPYMDEATRNQLQVQMSINDNIILWKTLLQDAKKYLLINHLRESIIALNSSFENFMYTQFTIVLNEYLGEENTKIFLKGEIRYEEHRMFPIITKEQFKKLEENNIINNTVPTIYQLVKKYYQIVPTENKISYTKTQFNKSINKIRKNRNDIVHGNEIGKLSSKEIMESISSFEDVIEKFSETHGDLFKPK